MKNGILEVQSKAMYSTWAYYKPLRVLFDCGEGFSTYQGNYIYGIDRIFLSHGHGDHISGLPPLIWARNSARGDRNKPLTVYYPEGDMMISNLINYISSNYSSFSFDLKFIGITGGQSVKITDKIRIESFNMKHSHYSTTLGYKVVESRRRLKPQYVSNNIPELIKSGVSSVDLHEMYEANTFTYALDTYQVNQSHISNCECLMIDCTFLDIKDRRSLVHYSLQEAYNLAVDANVRYMLCAHVSSRYNNRQISEAINKLTPSNTKVIPIYHNQVNLI